ncbi:MAG: hypothetical protein N3G77_02290 [Nitrososphaeria archaeon]|nr:hypothetical protein [Nitrososphaeria archaeon]
MKTSKAFGKGWRLGIDFKVKLLRLLYAVMPLLALSLNSVAAAEGIDLPTLTNNLTVAIQVFGGLIFAIALAFLGVGAACKFIPWASQRTKDFGGQLFDHAFILVALASVGGYLLVFAGQIAVGIVGQGGLIFASYGVSSLLRGLGPLEPMRASRTDPLKPPPNYPIHKK